MVMAANLNQAADFTSSNFFPLWQADTLKTKVIAFWTAALVQFPDQVVNNQPIANWLTIIAAFAPTILSFEQSASVGINTIATYEQAIDYVYRLFKLADANRTANLITAGQATALLAAYNAQFG